MIKENIRLRFVDLFRLICVFYIITFHSWMIFIDKDTSQGSSFHFIEWVEVSSKYLAIHSGIFIVAISFFLFGYNEKKLPFWRIFIFIAGFFLTQFNGSDDSPVANLESWKWGVFSFLMVSYFFAYLGQHLKKPYNYLYYFAFLGLLGIQSYQISAMYTPNTSPFVKQMLTGDLVSEDLQTGWFLIPWLAYPMFFVGLGLVFKKYSAQLKKSLPLFDMTLTVSFALSLAYYISQAPKFSIGHHFDQDIFNKGPMEMLPILGLPLLVFRWCLWEKISKAMDSKFIRWISNLEWNKNFWLCYLIHLCFLFGLEAAVSNDFFRTSPMTELLVPMTFVFTESLARALIIGFQGWKSIFLKLHKLAPLIVHKR